MLTRLAADHGYQATGIDTDTSMIAAARRLGRREQSSAVFVDRSLTDEPPMEPADVVAAASLLVVVPDPIVALGTLWQAVAPGGALLVVEATERLTTQRAASLIATGTLGRGATILRLWARARQGRTLDVSMLRGHPDTSEIVSTSLLDGMIGVWLIRPRIVSS
jgi:trans-aconitate methyltransferase